MYATLTATACTDTGAGKDEELRRYARWEYRSPEVAWLLAEASRPRERVPAKAFEAVPRLSPA